MAADLPTVIKQLTESSIIAQGKLEPFIPPKADPKTVEELVQALVKSENLTAFQGQQVKGGRAKSLILGEYTILDKIGAGGMGQVFKAQHRRLKRVVAIKMLPPAVTKDAAAVARFQREVEAAAKLRHPNVVATDDAGYANGVHFLVMEYVDGKDLSALVKKDGPFPVPKAVNYILQAARGLEFAHSEGVVHRDIKPANLLLDKKEVVKILDMGLARIEQADGGVQSELTGTGTIMGTVDYMSPEQALNTRDADQRADIYSLGMSLYYLLAGKAAYSGETAMQKLMAHQNQPIPSLQEVQTTVSKQLESVFKKMVAKRIEDRYQTMSEVVEALEGLGYGGSVTGRKGDVASTLDLSSADRKKLSAQAKKKPLGSITEVVASEKSKNLIFKIVGGSFGTIIAPLLVFYLIRHLEKEDKPHNPPAAVAPATVPPVVVATNTTTQTPAHVTSGGDQPNQPWNTPAFQTWVKATQALPAEKQIEAVSKKLIELNPGFDGKVTGWGGVGTPKIENGVLTELEFMTDFVTDISPVRALPGLKHLACSGSKGGRGRLSDLSPLKDTKLTLLNIDRTDVADLTPLRGLPLTNFLCGFTPVSDLSPLQGMTLADVRCFRSQVSDLSPLATCKNLAFLIVTKTKVTPASVSALQKALPNCKIEWDDPTKAPAQKLAYLDPAFQQWVADTQHLSAEKQVEAVSKKLMELNPGFDGKLAGRGQWGAAGTPRIENGVVTELGIWTDNVTDVSPLRALVSLKVLACNPSSGGVNTGLSDLSPLRGMSLTTFICRLTKSIQDLSPLEGMPLTFLDVYGTQVNDLSPLRGMPLTSLDCYSTLVTDLSPLQETKLTMLRCGGTKVADLSALRAMPLTMLAIGGSTFSDLLPLKGMPLTSLDFRNTAVSDLTPLEGCKSLRELNASNTKVTPAAIASLQKALPNCKIDWDDPSKAANKLAYLDPAFQQWVKATQTLPAEKQIEAVSKKLMELNPGFDGKVTGGFGTGSPKIENGGVTELGILTDNVTDISPVRALVGLQYVAFRTSNYGKTKGKLADLSPLQGMKLTKLDYSSGPLDLSQLHAAELTHLTNLSIASSSISELSPLRGMRLNWLSIAGSPVSDLRPLERMPLTDLNIANTEVSDLSPLKGMKLTYLFCANKVSDLSPLRGMPLSSLNCEHSKNLSDVSPLEDCKSLKWLRLQNTKVTAVGVAALQAKLPDCKVEWDDPTKKKLAYLDPAFQQWVKATQALPAEQQVEAVSKKLMELNPGFDGVVTVYGGQRPPKIENGVVVELAFNTENVTDLSPVGALDKLKKLSCTAKPIRGALTDLSPLNGMKLEQLTCFGNGLFDLSPLIGMPLNRLDCGFTKVSDLSPLRGMPLTDLDLFLSPASDWSPLAGCKSLTLLVARKTKVTPVQVAALQKALPNCKIEWDDPAKATKPKLAYLDPAFQAWVEATEALPAEQQIEAVSKKLMELNPGFDGNLWGHSKSYAPNVKDGVVTILGLDSEKVTDLSPLRAFSGLKTLRCSPKGGQWGRSRLCDLSPLIGMELTGLFVGGNPELIDLSPLEHCKGLVGVHAMGTAVTPASVAALQKALPNCKIEWDDPAKPKTPEPAASGTK